MDSAFMAGDGNSSHFKTHTGSNDLTSHPSVLPEVITARQAQGEGVRFPGTADKGRLSVNDDLFVIPDKDAFILYAPLAKSALMVNKAAVYSLQQFKAGNGIMLTDHPSFFRALEQSGILTRQNGVDISTPRASGNAGFDPDGVSLFLTTACSMRCIYCYAHGGDNPRYMTWEQAKAAIDWIVTHGARQGKKRLFVSFHGGGEVTKALTLMKTCAAYARSRARMNGITAYMDAGLNGVMDRPVVDWVIRNLDGATVSLDGLPQIQDFQRPLADGSGSYAIVGAALRRMDEKRFNYSIRTTVTGNGIGTLAESVASIAANFNPKTIQVEPVFIAGRALSHHLTPVDPVQFVAAYRQAMQAARTNGKELRYSGARLDVTTTAFCKGACGNSFAVTPEGLVTACYEVMEGNDSRSAVFHFGQYDKNENAFVFDREKIDRLQTLTVANKPNCAKCFCKWHCAGDCPAKLALVKDAWDTSLNPRCYINRELTKDQIRDHFLGSGRLPFERDEP